MHWYEENIFIFKKINRFVCFDFEGGFKFASDNIDWLSAEINSPSSMEKSLHSSDKGHC